ncbi:MAG TPA: hypothetical protein ENN69_06375 [Spirochaetia bacterium]|nr:hypothetical protein [Spirochaetia bacterium]
MVWGNRFSIRDFGIFVLQCVILHTATYFAAGMLFSNLFNYQELFRLDAVKDYYVAFGDQGLVLGPFL